MTKKTQEEQMNEICDSLITDDEVQKLLICLIKGRGTQVTEKECADFISHIVMARFVTHSAELALNGMVLLDWDGEGIGVKKI